MLTVRQRKSPGAHYSSKLKRMIYEQPVILLSAMQMYLFSLVARNARRVNYNYAHNSKIQYGKKNSGSVRCQKLEFQ